MPVARLSSSARGRASLHQDREIADVMGDLVRRDRKGGDESERSAGEKRRRECDQASGRAIDRHLK
jgi:hypothetical protein